MDGEPRFYRRARGYAPASTALPPGLEEASPVLALGGELKNTFCLIRTGRAIVSQHIGDLEDVATFDDYRRMLDLYADLFRHRAEVLAVDGHPGYRPTRHGRKKAVELGIPIAEVQHHHAHIAACMAENGHPFNAGAVLGIALDGLGYGPDGTLWGGEVLLADYRNYRRLACITPFPMIGGTQAIKEPWRCAYAQLTQLDNLEELKQRHATLPYFQLLESKPLELVERMLTEQLNCPLTSSAGRLFDAVAAVLGICAERIGYEGEAAIRLETLAWQALEQDGTARAEDTGYRLGQVQKAGTLQLDPTIMWQALFADLAEDVPSPVVALRFHRGLSHAFADLAADLCHAHQLHKIALSGGVFQNRLLFESLAQALRGRGLDVLTHSLYPTNDGCISYGQAVVAAARRLSDIP